jgi:hypothetical protein
MCLAKNVFWFQSTDHWSLTTIVNPGMISKPLDEVGDDEEFPCFIMLDVGFPWKLSQ